MRFIIGLDLGQSQDSTALAILERIEGEQPEGAATWRVPAHYECRHLHRFALGTRYPAIVESVGQLMQMDALKDQCRLVIDATGVGRPVCDMFKDAGMIYTGVTITGGHAESGDGFMYSVPKRLLVSTLQALLQSERLKVAPNPLRETLITEMLAFQVTITESANDTYAGRTGTHDDMVLAVALAAWHGERHSFVGWTVW
jgi:hypothetical protein